MTVIDATSCAIGSIGPVLACLALLASGNTQAAGSERWCWSIPELPDGMRQYCLVVNPKVVLTGQETTFSATVDPPRPGVEYQFTFDGQQRALTRNSEVSRVFEQSGSVVASVAFFDDDGLLIVETQQIRVFIDPRPAEPFTPVGSEPQRDPITTTNGDLQRNSIDVRLVADRSSVDVGERVHFLVTTEPLVEGVEYRLISGDGHGARTFNAASFSHVYEEPGNYAPRIELLSGDVVIANSELIEIDVVQAQRISDDEIDVVQAQRTSDDEGGGSTVKPVVLVTADQSDLKASEAISFAVTLEPPVEGVTYRYDFGGGGVPETSPVPSITRALEIPGSYEVVVEVVRDGEVIAMSDPLLINVKKRGTSGIWIVLLAVLVVSAISGWLRMRARRHVAPGSELTVRPIPDHGVPRIGRGRSPSLQFEVRLRPVLDVGIHQIRADTVLIEEGK
ncbi:MAG: hypothetical protein OER80_14360 [Gammaproteobacteria bacterium]|nr:hypothetical protein [Gammaproteobacteria bacterium]